MLQPNAELWEPYDGRLSRTVLREREGEVPSRHSPGFEIFEQSRKIAGNIKGVIADRAYTPKKISFVDPAHELKIDVVMDQSITTVKSAKQIFIGKEGETVIDHCGTFLHKFTPPRMWTPPKGLTGRDLEEWYAERFETCAWRMNDWLDDGGKQFVCAQCLGGFTSAAKTTMKPSARAKRSARRKRTTPGSVPRFAA